MERTPLVYESTTAIVDLAPVEAYEVRDQPCRLPHFYIVTPRHEEQRIANWPEPPRMPGLRHFHRLNYAFDRYVQPPAQRLALARYITASAAKLAELTRALNAPQPSPDVIACVQQLKAYGASAWRAIVGHYQEGPKPPTPGIRAFEAAFDDVGLRLPCDADWSVFTGEQGINYASPISHELRGDYRAGRIVTVRAPISTTWQLTVATHYTDSMDVFQLHYLGDPRHGVARTDAVRAVLLQDVHRMPPAESDAASTHGDKSPEAEILLHPGLRLRYLFSEQTDMGSLYMYQRWWTGAARETTKGIRLHHLEILPPTPTDGGPDPAIANVPTDAISLTGASKRGRGGEVDDDAAPEDEEDYLVWIRKKRRAEAATAAPAAPVQSAPAAPIASGPLLAQLTDHYATIRGKMQVFRDPRLPAPAPGTPYHYISNPAGSVDRGARLLPGALEPLIQPITEQLTLAAWLYQATYAAVEGALGQQGWALSTAESWTLYVSARDAMEDAWAQALRGGTPLVQRETAATWCLPDAFEGGPVVYALHYTGAPRRVDALRGRLLEGRTTIELDGGFALRWLRRERVDGAAQTIEHLEVVPPPALMPTTRVLEPAAARAGPLFGQFSCRVCCTLDVTQIAADGRVAYCEAHARGAANQ